MNTVNGNRTMDEWINTCDATKQDTSYMHIENSCCACTKHHDLAKPQMKVKCLPVTSICNPLTCIRQCFWGTVDLRTQLDRDIRTHVGSCRCLPFRHLDPEVCSRTILDCSMGSGHRMEAFRNALPEKEKVCIDFGNKECRCRLSPTNNDHCSKTNWFLTVLDKSYRIIPQRYIGTITSRVMVQRNADSVLSRGKQAWILWKLLKCFFFLGFLKSNKIWVSRWINGFHHS